jgi:hypothetical protein
MKKTENISMRVEPRQREILEGLGRGSYAKGLRRLLRAWEELERGAENPETATMSVRTFVSLVQRLVP